MEEGIEITEDISKSQEAKPLFLSPELQKAKAEYFPDEIVEAKIKGIIAIIPPDQPAETFLSQQISSELGKFLTPEEAAKETQIFNEGIIPKEGIPLEAAAIEALKRITSDPSVLKAYEVYKRKEFLKPEDFISLNEILSYHLTPDKRNVFLHLAPARTFTEQERNIMALEGFSELAKRLNEEQNLQGVERINATSWLVAKRPEQFTGLGFTLEGPIDEETRQKHFSHEKGPINRASIKKADFLERYGKD
jgi:hypothetical protein